MRATRTAWALLLALLAGVGCGPRPPAGEPAPPRHEQTTHGPVTVDMTFTPPTVRLDEDMLLELRVTAPEGMVVDLPPLEGRLEGFSIGGQFARDPVTQDGAVSRETHVQLTPVVAEEYRLAPLAITYRDERVSPPLAGWFATAPVLLATRPLVDGEAATTMNVQLEPVWVRPPARTVAGYAGLLVALAALALLGWRWLGRAREEIALRKLSPRERALRELDQLLRRDLVKLGRVKDFYVDLTMVVRRYIERQHAVRAPEQTTEEFLQAVSRDPRFSAEVMGLLRRFLESADRVKFAAYQPTAETTDQAVHTARDYIQRDAAVPGGEA